MTPTPPTFVADPRELLSSPDPRLAANKRLVFDMWRAIIQGGDVDQAPRFFTPGYIQHNPNVESGRDALVAFIRRTRPVRPIQDNIAFPVVALMAEGDLVLLATVSYAPDPEDPSATWAGTHFDLFRIEDGLIAEHWDSVPKDRAMLDFDPNTQNGA